MNSSKQIIRLVKIDCTFHCNSDGVGYFVFVSSLI